MKRFKSLLILESIVSVILLTSFDLNPTAKNQFPYKQAGLTERQAAAHLVSRFTFGARPGDVDKVVAIGLETWFQQQLEGNLSDAGVSERLKPYDVLTLSNENVLDQFPSGPELRKMAIQEGIISKDSISLLEKKEYKEQLSEYRKQKGLREEKEFFKQFFSQKIIRATYTENQLHEVLTDFWFNHFNVSTTKNQCARFVPAYERDAIRQNVTKKFEDILLATAKSPAMLLYLDNASSTGTNEELDKIVERKRAKQAKSKELKGEQRQKLPKKKSQGLNENYAREVMELHTLGVDGGYTQADVTEAARVLTGWTLYPIGKYASSAAIKKVIDKIGEDKLERSGFVHEGDFLFAANRHDSNPKKVLGHEFKGGGYQEGVELLKLLAHHPSTAKFICRKLTVRFVNDNPPQALIDKMATSFSESNGAITTVLTTLVMAPEFWSVESVRAKTKSPFEYAISTIRALDADVQQPIQVNQWITKMGQKLYAYQAPTGFPDKGQYWINTGSLLNRMNFGLAIASKKIPGVSFDLAALNNHHEPESAEAALPIYAKLMLPERNLDPTIKRLTPFINNPDVQKNVEVASEKKEVPTELMNDSSSMTVSPTIEKHPAKRKEKNSFGDNSMLAQVVGIIIGSPEFQRR